jgi:hypothetical protein
LATVSTDFDFALGRLRLVKLTSICMPYLKVLALSWHGPYKETNKKKNNFLKDFFLMVKEIRAIDDDKFRRENGKPLPLIIGGDFNIEISLWPNDPDLVYHKYIPSDRRKDNVIDMFVSTEDIRVKDLRYVDMAFKIEDGTVAADLLNNDPVEGVLCSPRRVNISSVEM